VLAAWADGDDLDARWVAALGDLPIGAREHWHVEAEVVRAAFSDSWKGWTPNVTDARALDPAEPALILISGNLRARYVPAFTGDAAGAVAHAFAHPGYLGGLAINSSPSTRRRAVAGERTRTPGTTRSAPADTSRPCGAMSPATITGRSTSCACARSPNAAASAARRRSSLSFRGCHCRLGSPQPGLGERRSGESVLTDQRSIGTEGGRTMSGETDELKGRAKEAAGDLTDDKSLKNEGKADRAAGKAKDAVDAGADKVKDVLRKD
jgi:uncharacterized protein YjbJ (UPF0337 family)